MKYLTMIHKHLAITSVSCLHLSLSVSNRFCHVYVFSCFFFFFKTLFSYDTCLLELYSHKIFQILLLEDSTLIFLKLTRAESSESPLHLIILQMLMPFLFSLHYISLTNRSTFTYLFTQHEIILIPFSANYN